jgi:hypothetical protein
VLEASRHRFLPISPALGSVSCHARNRRVISFWRQHTRLILAFAGTLALAAAGPAVPLAPSPAAIEFGGPFRPSWSLYFFLVSEIFTLLTKGFTDEKGRPLAGSGH